MQVLIFHMLQFDFNKAINEAFDFDNMDSDFTSEPVVDLENYLLEPLLNQFKAHDLNKFPEFCENSWSNKLENKDLSYFYLKPWDVLVITPDSEFKTYITKFYKKYTPVPYQYIGGAIIIGSPNFKLIHSHQIYIKTIIPTLNLGKAEAVLYYLIECVCPGFFKSHDTCRFSQYHMNTIMSMQESKDRYIKYFPTNIQLDFRGTGKPPYGRMPSILPPMLILYEPSKEVIKNLMTLKKTYGYKYTSINKLPDISHLIW